MTYQSLIVAEADDEDNFRFNMDWSSGASSARMKRRFWMPMSNTTTNDRMQIWILTDKFGATLLGKFVPAMMAKSGPFLLNHCHIMVQQAAGDLTGDVGGEFQVLMKTEKIFPDCIIVHVGGGYLGNKAFDLNTIQLKLETAFKIMKTLLARAGQEQATRVRTKLIWSHIIAHPKIGREAFSFRAAFEALKKINSEVAVTLSREGISILKHGEIDPKSCLFFDREGVVMEVTRRQFLRDVNDYAWELQTIPEQLPQPEDLPTSQSNKNKQPPKAGRKRQDWNDQILDGHKKRKEISKDLRALEEQLAEAQRINKEFEEKEKKWKHEAGFRMSPDRRKHLPSEGRDKAKVMRHDQHRWRGKPHPQERRVPAPLDTQADVVSEEERQQFREHLKFKQFMSTSQMFNKCENQNSQQNEQNVRRSLKF